MAEEVRRVVSILSFWCVCVVRSYFSITFSIILNGFLVYETHYHSQFGTYSLFTLEQHDFTLHTATSQDYNYFTVYVLFFNRESVS